MHPRHRYNHLIFLLAIATILFSVTSSFAVSYNYDDLNRLCAVQYDNNWVIQYGYDEAGNRTGKKVFYNPSPAPVPSCIVTMITQAPPPADKGAPPASSGAHIIGKSAPIITNDGSPSAVKSYTIIGTKNQGGSNSVSNGIKYSNTSADPSTTGKR